MAIDTPLIEIMATDLLTFGPDDDVASAIRELIERGYNGAPVIEPSGRIAGMLTATDLIVRGVRIHFPTVVNFLGVNIEIPSLRERHVNDDIEKLLGGKVSEVMHTEVVTVNVSGTVQDAATIMHDEDVSRLPVVDDEWNLKGLVTRKDILRALLA